MIIKVTMLVFGVQSNTLYFLFALRFSMFTSHFTVVTRKEEGWARFQTVNNFPNQYNYIFVE